MCQSNREHLNFIRVSRCDLHTSLEACQYCFAYVMRTASTPDLSRIAAITAVAVTSILLQVLSRTLEEISMLLLDFQWASQVARNANANTLPYAHMRAHARTHTRTPERTHACPHALETTEHETSDCWHVCVCVCVCCACVRACGD